jgi:hypothetical protein
MRNGIVAAAVGLGAALTLVLPALAAPEEIEVYRADLNAPGAFTLETNHSYVVSGPDETDYPGQQASDHRYRLTPELSYGLTPNWELGALVVTTLDASGRYGVSGAKARIRYIAPHDEYGFYWGGNFEVGRVAHRIELNPWGEELRGIAGYEGRRWILAVNPTLEWSISGPKPEPVSFQMQSKLGYRVDERLILGLESYNSFGPVQRFSRPQDEEQMLYATADMSFKRVSVNLGLGRGLSGASDGWVAKAVIAIPLSGR